MAGTVSHPRRLNRIPLAKGDTGEFKIPSSSLYLLVPFLAGEVYNERVVVVLSPERLLSMSAPASSPGSLYQQLIALPVTLVGEIIGGRLYTQPRPAAPHALVASSLGADVHSAYHRGRA